MLTLPHFQFIYALMGAERILFSVDYPYQTLDGVKTFIDSLPVNKAEKEAIAFSQCRTFTGHHGLVHRFMMTEHIVISRQLLVFA